MSMTIGRRGFGKTLAAAGLVTAAGGIAAPLPLRAAEARVVVIGGGPGGTTLARFLKAEAPDLQVTLIEANPQHTTCFYSNLYLGGLVGFDDITHGYDGLRAIGVEVVQGRAAGVDPVARSVTLEDGASLPYDRLVLAPGIAMRWGAIEGYDEAAAEAMPHAYQAGPQTRLLLDRLLAMREGGTYLMVAPPNPYRCPPGPYERISMVAHLLKQTNPTAKILVLDPKDKFSKQALFEEGWQRHYDGMVTWVGPDFGGGAVEVRPAAMEVVVDGEVQKVDVCNVIPGQMAGKIAQIAGVTNDSGWAPVDPASMQSKLDANVWVLGDSSAQGDMPKSAFSANSQAKVAAMAIRGDLTGSRTFPAKYSNTCWSLIAPEDGVKVGASYEPTPDKIASVHSFISQTGEDAALRKVTYEESLGWYAGITADIFG